MLEPVLDPFDRAPGDTRSRAHQHDVGKDRELRAEAAAAVGRRPQAQPRPRHAQRARHHRMDAERALEIRGRVVAVVRGVVLGRDDEAFDRRKRIARIAHAHFDARIGFGKGARGIAIDEVPLGHDVRSRILVDERRARGDGIRRIDHGWKPFVLDLEFLAGVLGAIAVLRQHDRHRLADETHALDRQGPLRDRRLHRDEKRIGQLAHILARDDGCGRRRVRSAAVASMRAMRAWACGERTI